MRYATPPNKMLHKFNMDPLYRHLFVSFGL